MTTKENTTKIATIRSMGSKGPVVLAGVLAIILMLVGPTTAYAKSAVGVASYTRQQLQQLVNDLGTKERHL
jgi:hypothetical protein